MIHELNFSFDRYSRSHELERRSDNPFANELKVVIFNKTDFNWAEKQAERVSPNCKLYLQPEWSRRQEMTPMIVEYVKANPNWEISLQTHKFMQIP